MIKNNLKTELKNLICVVKTLDKKVITIFLSVAILQTISFYFTSRRFFRANLFESFQNYSDPYLIEYIYWFVGDFFTFFVLGVLIIKFGFREKLKDFGLQFGDVKTGLLFSIIFLFVMITLVWFVSSTPEFAEKYPHLTGAKSNWNILLIYEAGMLLYMFAWEFIWRGFMLFGLEKKFGYYSVLIQMIPFVILHNGKPFLETFGAIFGGIALGILALRTRSFYYCVIIHIGVMFSIDIISSLRFRANDYGIGIASLINIIRQIF
ncbi:MAG: CPBP family intramembrane metalloprotease [Ignavibacteriales bacterium]|nr:CPBP family intramembrane metalloprotease [Ignavibacteriales bacterium]